MSETFAQGKLADKCDAGRVSANQFKALLEECVSRAVGAPVVNGAAPQLQQTDMVRQVLGVLTDFEKRARLRRDFPSSAEARKLANELQQQEAGRLQLEMNERQVSEKSGVREAHVMEAVEFNSQWTKNTDQFEMRAVQLVAELQQRHASALAAYEEQQREEARHPK